MVRGELMQRVSCSRCLRRIDGRSRFSILRRDVAVPTTMKLSPSPYDVTAYLKGVIRHDGDTSASNPRYMSRYESLAATMYIVITARYRCESITVGLAGDHLAA
jgi:hypothetical protein